MTWAELSGLQPGDIISNPPESYKVVKVYALRRVIVVARTEKPNRGCRFEIAFISLLNSSWLFVSKAPVTRKTLTVPPLTGLKL